MKSLLIVLSFSLLVATTVAHNSCVWHAANDVAPDFAHYDAEHDDDGDGIGCPTITGLPPVPETTTILIELDETGSYVEDTPTTAPDTVPATTASAVPSVELLVNSNFRRGPGLAFVIVGGGAAGSVYQWAAAEYGADGYIWYRLVLPAGEGWVRGDLIRLLDAGNIPENTPTPTDSP